ncbi:MAG: hypothetical protein K6T91_03395 [Firmicutes bacterium]|nr:hypothetical protein [Bacillota bacterium]
MAELKLVYSQVKGFPYIKLEGDLTVNSFTALHLVVKGATKFGTVPVIVDLSGDLHIADDVKEIRCFRYPANIPDYARRVVLAVISSTERLEEIKALLTPHELRHVTNLEEAFNVLHKTA